MRVLVFGATGFIGRQVIGYLVKEGHTVHAVTRRYASARELLVYPTVTVLEADLQDQAALRSLVSSCDAVINLVGILHSRNGQPFGPDFDRVHVQLPRRIAQACREADVARFIHMSALGASADGPSCYLRSKAAGEQAVADEFSGWSQGAYTFIRPSVVFGPRDQFMNMFAQLAKWFPILPLAGAKARMQPVYVDDVAKAMVNALQRPQTYGRSFDLVGPKIYTLGELVRLAAVWSGHPRKVVAMPFCIGWLQALLFECLPGQPLMSRDNLASLKIDNVSEHLVDNELGVVATPLESIVPNYLKA